MNGLPPALLLVALAVCSAVTLVHRTMSSLSFTWCDQSGREFVDFWIFSGCLYVPAYSSVHSFIFFFVYEAKLPVTINREPTYSYWLLPGILQNSKAHGSDCGCGASRGGIDSVCIANNRGDFTHFAFFRCIAPSKASRNVLGDCDKSHFNQVYLIVCNWF